MKRYSAAIALSGVLALCTTAWAGASPTALSLPRISLEPIEAIALVAPAEVPSPDIAVMPGFARPPAPSLAGHPTILEAVRWRPRRTPTPGPVPQHSSSGSSGGSSGFSQLHGGFFDLDGEKQSGFVGGFRGGATIDNHLQLGVAVDWNYKSDEQTEIVSIVPLPGGGTAERRIELARSSSHLVPAMAFLQLLLGNVNGVHPYIGGGGGYETLFLSAEDFTTGEQFDATYGGWGWQVWAGLGIQLSGKTGITAEVFRNVCEVERIDGPSTGEVYREIVDVHGVGGRFGLNWRF